MKCKWQAEDQGCDESDPHYETSCGESFYFVDSSLEEQPKFIWCPFCGKKINHKEG